MPFLCNGKGNSLRFREGGVAAVAKAAALAKVAGLAAFVALAEEVWAGGFAV